MSGADARAGPDPCFIERAPRFLGSVVQQFLVGAHPRASVMAEIVSACVRFSPGTLVVYLRAGAHFSRPCSPLQHIARFHRSNLGARRRLGRGSKQPIRHNVQHASQTRRRTEGEQIHGCAEIIALPDCLRCFGLSCKTMDKTCVFRRSGMRAACANHLRNKNSLLCGESRVVSAASHHESITESNLTPRPIWMRRARRSRTCPRTPRWARLLEPGLPMLPGGGASACLVQGSHRDRRE